MAMARLHPALPILCFGSHSRGGVSGHSDWGSVNVRVNTFHVFHEHTSKQCKARPSSALKLKLLQTKVIAANKYPCNLAYKFEFQSSIMRQ